jgi:hypothetical protein
VLHLSRVNGTYTGRLHRMRAFSGTPVTFPYFALVVLAILLPELFVADGS